MTNWTLYLESIELLEPNLEVSCGNCRRGCYMDAECVLRDFMDWSPKEADKTCTAGTGCPFWYASRTSKKCGRHSEPCALYKTENVKALSIKEMMDAIVELAKETQVWYEVLTEAVVEGRLVNNRWYEVYLDKIVELIKKIEEENEK